MVSTWHRLVLGFYKEGFIKLSEGLCGSALCLNAPRWWSIGHIPADPGRPVYYPATYRGIRLERGQRYQTQARSTAQQTWPGGANRQRYSHVISLNIQRKLSHHLTQTLFHHPEHPPHLEITTHLPWSSRKKYGGLITDILNLQIIIKTFRWEISNVVPES